MGPVFGQRLTNQNGNSLCLHMFSFVCVCVWIVFNNGSMQEAKKPFGFLNYFTVRIGGKTIMARSFLCDPLILTQST